MEEHILTIIKTFGMFAVGLIAFRIMGSQSVGRLTDFDLVVVIGIGAIIGDVLASKEINVWIALTAILGLVVSQVITSLLAMKNPWFEKVIMGKPIQVISKGRILKNGLRRARLTENNLMQELRINGLDSAANVEKAYLEPAGKLSIIKQKKL